MKLDLPGEVALTAGIPDAKALLVVHDHRGRSEMYRYDLASGRRHEAPDRARLDRERARASERRGLVHARSLVRARRRSGSRGEVVLRPAGAPAPSGVAYSDADVDAVHIFVAQPPKAGPHPTYFFIHGGPECMTPTRSRRPYRPG